MNKMIYRELTRPVSGIDVDHDMSTVGRHHVRMGIPGRIFPATISTDHSPIVMHVDKTPQPLQQLANTRQPEQYVHNIQPVQHLEEVHNVQQEQHNTQTAMKMKSEGVPQNVLIGDEHSSFGSLMKTGTHNYLLIALLCSNTMLLFVIVILIIALLFKK